MATERSRDARTLAEATVVALVHELGDFEAPMILLGGLVPEILTRDQTPPVPHHLGTNDADILLDMQVAPSTDLSPIERCLERLGFAPEGVRLIGTVSGATMKVEFLCELDDQPAEAVVIGTGCTKLGAMNLRGTGYVREDWQVVDLTGALSNGRVVSVPVRVAGLGGYLLAKGTALKNGSKDKGIAGHSKARGDWFSTAADLTVKNPDDARAMAIETYRLLVELGEKNPTLKAHDAVEFRQFKDDIDRVMLADSKTEKREALETLGVEMPEEFWKDVSLRERDPTAEEIEQVERRKMKK